VKTTEKARDLILQTLRTIYNMLLELCF